jgi:hypothetical protein
MVDTGDLKSPGRKAVRVRVPLAPLPLLATFLHHSDRQTLISYHIKNRTIYPYSTRMMRMHHVTLMPPPFLGRLQEMDEIATLLSDPSCRLLTLVGPGGIGKTRLALEVASQQRASFPDGLFFCITCLRESSRRYVASYRSSYPVSIHAGYSQPTRAVFCISS